jgi:hypothetical protein
VPPVTSITLVRKKKMLSQRGQGVSWLGHSANHAKVFASIMLGGGGCSGIHSLRNSVAYPKQQWPVIHLLKRPLLIRVFPQQHDSGRPLKSSTIEDDYSYIHFLAARTLC